MFPVAGQRTKANSCRGGICFLFSKRSENKCDRGLSLPSCVALRRETLIGWTNGIIDWTCLGFVQAGKLFNKLPFRKTFFYSAVKKLPFNEQRGKWGGQLTWETKMQMLQGNQTAGAAAVEHTQTIIAIRNQKLIIKTTLRQVDCLFISHHTAH